MGERAQARRAGGVAVSADRGHMAAIGRRGGRRVSRDRAHMAAIGRRGGLARADRQRTASRQACGAARMTSCQNCGVARTAVGYIVRGLCARCYQFVRRTGRARPYGPLPRGRGALGALAAEKEA